MQPSYTLLCLEFLFLAVTLSIWFVRRRGERRSLALEGGTTPQIERRQPRPRRRGNDESLRDVPIPWGWPNCGKCRGRRNERSVSESLHHFADVLFKEKRLVSDARLDPRLNASIKALIEDRYRPVDRDQETLPENQPMIVEDIWFVGPIAESRAAANRKYRDNLHEVRKLRAPWGW